MTPHRGRAQNAPVGGRFAFADTTLLRDTLGLHFDTLFPLADSLGVVPDSLRAWSIRYRMPLGRITFLADSLHMPVDSVGPVMKREEFNPLANRVAVQNTFTYRSGYDIQQTSTSWSNNADWRYVRGPWFLQNTTTMLMDRQAAGRETNLRQVRSSVTEAGWKFSNNTSLGGRANLERFDSRNPGDLNNEHEIKNEFQLSARGRQQPTRAFGTEFALFTGVLDVSNVSQVKRGFSGDISGRARYQTPMLSNDVTVRLNGNLAQTRLPLATSEFPTHDRSTSVDGTFNAFGSEAVSINMGYGLNRNRIETLLDRSALPGGKPGDVDLQQIRTDTDRLLATVRLRKDNDRYLNVSERLGRATNATATNLSALNQRGDQSFGIQGRWTLLGAFLDANFDHTYSNTQFPNRGNQAGVQSGYGDKTSNRSLNATLTRPLGRRFTLRAEGRVTLTVSRYYEIGSYANLPVDRDQYRQIYKLDGQFTQSARFSTGVALDVTRLKFVNIPSASTGANNETRSYRTEWRWTYQLLPGLTATQRNELSADYVFYDFLPANNRVSLNYKTLTTLNALLTPRTTMEITHDSQSQPSGNYTRFADGQDYFSKADDTRNLTLRARMSYRPADVLSLNVQSEYFSTVRNTSTEAGTLPQRDSRSLNFSAGATMDVPLGPSGHLTGDLHRTYRADRTIGFQGGIAVPTPRSEFDYWNGRLELTWNL